VLELARKDVSGDERRSRLEETWMRKRSEEAEEVEEIEDTAEKELGESKTTGEETEAEGEEEAGGIEEVTEEETKEVMEEIEEEAEEAEEVEAKEERAEKRERKEAEEEIVEERLYTIPLGRAWISPRKKRAPRAMRLIRSFVERHMKMRGGGSKEGMEEVGRLLISNEVNEKVWSRGIEKPPRKIRVRLAKDKEGTVTVYLAQGD
jgi:large subunit ribosomal protein L31e